ncbi:795_t:CDS:2 [Paraglomus brasilianum]|uniref:795_t:CDS:1 n=1 Tax=Paraglomus brasilianum TaxID=144538 RepID=A0A9N9DIT4_9GLOM|nr:795_t:CDS:2 [Paraglomus brasilianum]
MSIKELLWKDPTASQVISDDSKLVKKLPGNLRKGFMNLSRKMNQEMCREFVLDFNKHEIEMKPAKLIRSNLERIERRY